MSDGYIKLHRKIKEWQWYNDLNTRVLFLHILLSAEWKTIKKGKIELKAGQLDTSLPKLSEETGLSVQQIRTALANMISTGEITSSQQGKTRVITVNNWDEYQIDNRIDNREITGLQQDEQQDDNRMITGSEGAIYHIPLEEKEEEKKLNINNHNKYIYSASFELFWSEYPNKKGKDRAYKCYQARLKDGFTEDQLLTACKNYAAYCKQKGTEQQYIKHPSTFLSSNKDFVDYLEMPEEVAPVKPQPKPVQTETEKYGIPIATYNKIHDYPERTYDWAALEREFLGKGVDNG